MAVVTGHGPGGRRWLRLAPAPAPLLRFPLSDSRSMLPKMPCSRRAPVPIPACSGGIGWRFPGVVGSTSAPSWRARARQALDVYEIRMSGSWPVNPTPPRNQPSPLHVPLDAHQRHRRLESGQGQAAADDAYFILPSRIKSIDIIGHSDHLLHVVNSATHFHSLHQELPQ